jgi:hypothetical protein
MRQLIRVLFTMSLCGSLPAAFAQDLSTRSGFAVITLVSGNTAGLTATETLINGSTEDVALTTVAPSVLLTNASMLVTVGPASLNTTAIVLANPSMGAGGVNLLLTNQSGGIVLNAIVRLGPRGQIARFLNDFFDVEPTGPPTPLLLTLSAEIPVAVLALNFRNGDFTSVPMTSLANPLPVIIQPVTPLFGIPNTGPGFGSGVATLPSPPVIVSPNVSVFRSSPVPTSTSIGGAASLIFPHVATGAGWVSEIVVGNTSSSPQTIRIDFFGSDGANVASLTNIVINSRSLFFFSTATASPPIF